MMQLLKVEEWEGTAGWYVADVKTWTGWQGIAAVLDARDVNELMGILEKKYRVTAMEYNPTNDLLYFFFEKYKDAHQLKLDVNRIARKRNFQVEKRQKTF